MKHSTMCKIRYALWSIPMTLCMRMKGIKTEGIVFSGGMLFAIKAKGSKIRIGKRCRFMNWSMGNLIGLNHRCIIATDNESSRLSIGDRCSFSGTSIWCFDSVTIKDNVRVGANVTIMDGDAHQDDPRAGRNAPIVIEDNVWIGANTTILKGVTIGRNALIGAGSIVTKDIPANVVAAGTPCVTIRVFDDEKIKEIERYFK